MLQACCENSNTFVATFRNRMEITYKTPDGIESTLTGKPHTGGFAIEETDLWTHEDSAKAFELLELRAKASGSQVYRITNPDGVRIVTTEKPTFLNTALGEPYKP